MRTAIVNIGSVRHTGLRADASYHLSKGQDARRAVEHSPYPLTTVGEVTKEIFYGTRAKRVYVSKRENGIPFLSSSDIMSADLENIKLASRKYTPDIERMTLQEGWTLISRSGTVGNCAYSTGRHAQKLASEHVIRVAPGGHPNDILRGGMLYAYLASHYGHSLLTQGTFGAVIQHIEPSFIASLPIPVFPAAFQEEVDTLVKTAASLRDQAAKDLEKAHRIIEDNIHFKEKEHTNITNIQTIQKSHNTRFEAFYHNSQNRQVYNHIISNTKYKYLNKYTDRIFRPGIFKRDFVENGYMFLGGADILMATPYSEKRLSKRQVSQMPELRVKKGWILLTCGGTIGNVVCVDKQLEQCVISQHVMRIVPKDNVANGVLFAFLSSELGRQLITLFSTGSVIPAIEAHHIELIPIPIFEKPITDSIEALTMNYISNIEESKTLESKAIAMVEQEIERWQTKK